MRYSISNAIPHNPKSEKHPYENLVNKGISEFYSKNGVDSGIFFLCADSSFTYWNYARRDYNAAFFGE